jgi:hypothetical protein
MGARRYNEHGKGQTRQLHSTRPLAGDQRALEDASSNQSSRRRTAVAATRDGPVALGKK